MAYVTSNPPVCVREGGVGGQSPALWVYTSTDAASVVDGSGYFTNGGALGMKVNDRVEVTDNDASPVTVTLHRVVSVSATSPGAVDLSDGTTIITGTNTD